jgi:hypothetical protein
VITFQVEPWPLVRGEASLLWQSHYDEIGIGKTLGFPLDPDFPRLDRTHALGGLHIVTVRADGILVGYHASFVDTLVHYRTVLIGNSDLYWLRPDMRKGRVALRLFQKVEETLRARGVKILFDATKLELDRGELFEFLGYVPLERRYYKVIGG